ncbi:MAG: hypothetical protein MR016_05215 [Agathobacter sp.]|nr:hypothetical protein [Agathobacter sp.]
MSGKSDIPVNMGNASATADEESGQMTEAQENRELYLITAINSPEETIQLYRYRNGKEYRFSYAVDTVFRDKYGKRSTVFQFYPGKAVTIGDADAHGKLSEVAAADDVWIYDDIVRFSVDESKGIFRIADTNYRITDDTRVFSDDSEVSLSSISTNDKLSVTGQDKNILSVCITTGHGNLKLTNTELFEGSFLQLNTNIFAEITPEMELELPEGEYMLTVANNGWGGSCNVEVVRGETTELDLDTIKGEGPKYGSIQFVFDVEGAILEVDGEKIDYSEPVELQYGQHSLRALCNGYDEVKKYLFVNSDEATIMIALKQDENTETETGSEAEPEAGTQAETETQSETQTESGSDNISEADILKDYMSTLTELINGL